MKESNIDDVATRHRIPSAMLHKAIDLERNSITLQNRRMGPKLRDLISEYVDDMVTEEVES